jgi:hypothetical protein
MPKPKTKINPTLYYTPRILAILFILFLSLFSLDIFGQGYTLLETITGLFMHNIPSLILTITLIIAWRYPLIGAIIYTAAGIFYMIMISNKGQFIAWSLIIAAPAILIGILFFFNWLQKRK